MRSTSTSQSGARSSQSMTTTVERSAGSRSMYQVNASLARMYALPVVATLPTVASPIRPGQGPSSRARRRRSPAHGGRYGEKVARKAGPVGRDDVLAELRRVVDEAVAGRGHLLLLAGEAGIGKTTMLAAAAGLRGEPRRPGGLGLGLARRGRARYWPWVQVMRMLGLDIPWPAEDSGQPVRDAPASERFRLFDEVTSLLLAESRIQPLLLLLDDLQWADQPSQLLLDFLARRLPAGAVAVVGGYRDTRTSSRARSLAALAARTTVLPLTGLGPDAVGAPGRGRGGGAARGRGRGRRAPADRRQPVLRAAGLAGCCAAARRASRRACTRPSNCGSPPCPAPRPPRCGRPPSSASGSPRTWPPWSSGQPSGAVTEALAAAVRARVVSRDGTDAYRFAHDLFREYAYDQLPAAERASLHRRIGQALEASRAAAVTSRWPSWPGTSCSRTRPRPRPGSTAWPRPGRRPPGWPTRKRSGTGSTRSPPRTPGQPSRTGALLELAEARRRAGQGQAAGQAYLRAAELAGRNAQDPAALARAALGLHCHRHPHLVAA